ncbi:hypothetical protein KI387_031247, partial [Taxus chinensis]
LESVPSLLLMPSHQRKFGTCLQHYFGEKNDSFRPSNSVESSFIPLPPFKMMMILHQLNEVLLMTWNLFKFESRLLI